MKRGIVILFALLITVALMTGCEPMKGEEAVSVRETVQPKKQGVTVAKETDKIVIADFNSGEKPNNIGGNFGAWDKDPADFSQGCTESFDSANRRGVKGFAMKIDYDVDSKNPAYNGFWMFLQNLDTSKYDNLSFWVKGDSKEGYTTVFKVELKNAARQVGRYYVTNVTDKWQKIVIPFKDFKGITDFSNLTEF
ncbi:MAG: carbohydrate binding domain-containing protein, partial [Candidatus Omnitrophota bacterium]